MISALLNTVRPLLPVKTIACFEDPNTFATSQIVTVTEVGEEWTKVATRDGREFTLNTVCVQLHHFA